MRINPQETWFYDENTEKSDKVSSMLDGERYDKCGILK